MIFAIEPNNVYIGLEAVLAIIVVAGVAGVARANFKNTNRKTADDNANEALGAARALIEIQKEQPATQALELKDLQLKHLESQKSISNLEGQVHTLSTLQLDRIGDTLEAMRQLLAGSAVTLANDTSSAAAAVRQVKADLAK